MHDILITSRIYFLGGKQIKNNDKLTSYICHQIIDVCLNLDFIVRRTIFQYLLVPFSPVALLKILDKRCIS